jgi:hypothetical protein
MKLTGWTVAIVLIILGIVLALPVLWIVGVVLAGINVFRLLITGVALALVSRELDKHR